MPAETPPGASRERVAAAGVLAPRAPAPSPRPPPKPAAAVDFPNAAAAGTLHTLRHRDARRLGRKKNAARAHATLSNTMYMNAVPRHARQGFLRAAMEPARIEAPRNTKRRGAVGLGAVGRPRPGLCVVAERDVPTRSSSFGRLRRRRRAGLRGGGRRPRAAGRGAGRGSRVPQPRRELLRMRQTTSTNRAGPGRRQRVRGSACGR